MGSGKGDCMTVEIEVSKYKQLLYSPAWRYIPEYYVELFSNLEHVEGIYLPNGPEDYVFVAHISGSPREVMGFIVAYDWRLSVVTAAAYTLPVYRRQGIHTTLFKAMRADAIERGMSEITSNTHVWNEASKQSQLKQGRQLSGFSFVTALPTKPDSTKAWNLGT